MKFIKTREFVLWAGLNAVFPIIVSLIFAAFTFPLETQSFVAYFAIFAILGGNIYALVKFPKFRVLFAITIILNLLATLMLGDISFVTSIPNLPFLFKSIIDLASQ